MEFRVDDNVGRRHFDDLALDYSLSQVISGLSVLEGRGRLPHWAADHAAELATTLSTVTSLPPHVGAAAEAVCREHGYTIAQIVGGLRSLQATGTPGASCGIRTIRGFAKEWRTQLRSLRPPPRFASPGS